MSKLTVACDVDGVVADLIGGFLRFVREKTERDLDINKIDCYNIEKSNLSKENEDLNIAELFDQFYSDQYVYQFYVEPVDNSIRVLENLSKDYDIIFLTATPSKSPQSFISKTKWLDNYFGGIKVISCPAEYKHFFDTDYIIDDRPDTCMSFHNKETSLDALLFRQPWSINYGKTYDWNEIEEYFK